MSELLGSNIGAASGSLAKNMGAAIGVGAADSALGGLFGLIGAKLQYKYNKKLMNQQYQYQQAAFDREMNAMADLPSIQAEGLRRAGFSTADPNGTGFQQVSPSQASPSLPSTSVTMPGSNIAGALGAVANADLMSSQSALNRIEAKYRAKKLEGEIGKYNVEIDQIKQTLPETVNKIKQDILTSASQQKFNEKQAEVAGKTVEQLAQVVKGLQLDNKYKDDLNRWSLDKLKKEVYILGQDGKIKDVEAKLAEYGILVNADGLTNLFSIASSGNLGKISVELGNALSELLNGLPKVVNDCLEAVITGIFSHDKSFAERWFPSGALGSALIEVIKAARESANK